MRKSDRVDRYLRQLERELGPMPDDARARVVADVRDQIKKGLAKGRTSAAVLKDIGAPKLIAMSHMKIKPTAHETSPWVRWTAIATVGLFALILAGGLGWILLNKQRVRSAPAAAAARAMVDGRWSAQTESPAELRITFNVGKLELRNSTDGALSWTCAGVPKVTADHSVLHFVPDQEVAQCEIAVPAGLRTKVAAANGHLDVRKPRYPLDIDLTNGRVSLAPDPARAYAYQLHVKNGLQDFFRSAPGTESIKVRINVVNGSVKKE